MFCFDKQWIILIPVLLHFLDCIVSSHLLPSSLLLNSTLAQLKIRRENGTTVPQLINLSKILIIFQRWYLRCFVFSHLTIVCLVFN